MNEVRFTVLIYLKNPEPENYRQMLFSLAEEEYTNYEVYFLSATGSPELTVTDDRLESVANRNIYAKLASEIFPLEGKFHFRELGENANAARAYNTGMRFANGDYVIFLGQEDRIAPDLMMDLEEHITGSRYLEKGSMSMEELTIAASGNMLRRWKDTAPDLLYTDHDELIQDTRMNPHFKGEFNRELLLQSDYIGCSFCISIGLLRRLGFFEEKLNSCEFYEYMLRVEGLLRKGEHCLVVRIPRLLYHQRIRELPENVYKKLAQERYDTYLRLAKEHQKKYRISGSYFRDGKFRYWKLEKKRRDYQLHRKEYLFLREESIEAKPQRVLPMLYARLAEPDVAVVAPRILNDQGKIDNVGLIYDREGILYPACSNQSAGDAGYLNRIAIAQEISCADPDCCLIDAAVYKKLRGFRRDLSPRDRMLDFCLRARAAGYRVVYEPDAVVKRKKNTPESSELSHLEMLRMYGPKGENGKVRFGQGDPHYNPNLPAAPENYVL